MVEHRSDEALLAEHLTGKTGAFDVLVGRYVDGLYAFFKRVVANAAVAEDLVQETFLQVHLAGGSFDPARSFRPWLYTVAANKARDYMRARGRRPVQSLDASWGDAEGPTAGAQVEAAGTAGGEQVDGREQIQEVRAVIAQMPEHLRLILVLGYYQRLPYVEIAEILGIPVGTVKSRLHSAVSQFAQMWLVRAKNATPE